MPSATAATPTDLAAQLRERGALPVNDPVELARRYQGIGVIAKPAAPAAERTIGESRQFVVPRITPGVIGGTSPPDVVTVSATLLARSEHAYFYFDAALGVDAAAAEGAARRFEAATWPRVTGVFGAPPSPGVDGDPRIIVLQTDLGAVGGFHQREDVFPRTVLPQSNEAEMVYLDSAIDLSSARFDVVLAHELQHLIHTGLDRSEEVWVNEGMSEYALALAGGALTTIDAFAAAPGTQLNFWASPTQPHYGASAAFMRYIAARFGGDAALGRLAAQQGDGAAGIDEFLAATGETARFGDVFADWIAANVLGAASGPYAAGGPMAIEIEETLAAGERRDGRATQFGTDYYRLDVGAGEHTVRFSGATEVPVLPVEADATGFYWSNTGDAVDTTLTSGDVDLSAVAAPALAFRSWYDIERWYDWGYVAVSTDGGATWTALAGTSTTTEDPVGLAYGPGFGGESGGGPAWIDERVDLSAYAGQRVRLRFEYVTDGGTHGEGWAVDDVRIDDVAAQPDWQADGWVRVDQPLPQTYAVRLLAEGADGEPVVQDVPLAGAQPGVLRFDATGLRNIVLAVAGTTEGTTQTSSYSVELMGP